MRRSAQVFVLAAVFSLVFAVSLSAYPSPWKYFGSKSGVEVSWRWEKFDNGSFKAELKFYNNSSRAVRVSARPFFTTVEGMKWVGAGMVFDLEPKQTKTGVELGRSQLPALFHAAPDEGGYQSMVVTSREAETSVGSWVIDQETDGVLFSWRWRDTGNNRPVSELRVSNLTGEVRQVSFQAWFRSAKDDLWTAPKRQLTLEPREVLAGAEAELEYLPVYRFVDPYSAHERWLASAEPPISGGASNVVVRPQN